MKIVDIQNLIKKYGKNATLKGALEAEMKENNPHIFIQLRDKETGKTSNKVKLEDIIYDQGEIEFYFGEYGEEDYETLSYKDFLFYRDDFEIIKIVEY